MVNPFVGIDVAARYARARPPLHHRVIEVLTERGISASRAVDFGCGTGLSTHPLSSVAEFVVEVDMSRDMLAAAERVGEAQFAAAAIERLPFKDETFELASVASAIHWFAPPAIDEIRRVLTAHGVLVVYDVWFPGEMLDAPAFSDWLQGVFGPRYPQVEKRHSNLDSLPSLGFESLFRQDGREAVAMTLELLADYLMTHSERIAAVRTGVETEDEQRRFLLDALQPFYSGRESRKVLFGLKLETYQRNASQDG